MIATYTFKAIYISVCTECKNSVFLKRPLCRLIPEHKLGLVFIATAIVHLYRNEAKDNYSSRPIDIKYHYARNAVACKEVA